MENWIKAAILLVALAVVGCSSADGGVSQQKAIDRAVSQTIEAKSEANPQVDSPPTATTIPPTPTPFQDVLPASSILQALSAEYLAAGATAKSNCWRRYPTESFCYWVFTSEGKVLEYDTRKSVAIYLAQTCLSDREPTTSEFRDFALETIEGKPPITQHLDEVLFRIQEGLHPDVSCARRYLEPTSTAEALLAIDMVSPMFNDFPANFREILISGWETTANGSYASWLSTSDVMTEGFLMWFCEEQDGLADC